MSEVTLRAPWMSGQPTITIYANKIRDLVSKVIIPINVGKSPNNRTPITSKKVIDLNRSMRRITVEGKVDSKTAYCQLKQLRSRGGSVRFTSMDDINNTSTPVDPDLTSFGNGIYGINLVIESMELTISAQDRVDDSEEIVYEVSFTGISATLDEN